MVENKIYKLKSMFISSDDNNIYIKKNFDEILGYEKSNDFIKYLMFYLNGVNTVKEIYSKLNKDYSITFNEFLDIFREIFLVENLVVEVNETTLSLYEQSKYDRQIKLFEFIDGIKSTAQAEEIQKNLKNKHVLLLGVGGIGSHTSHSLVAMGLGEITLLDFDRIELSNITRQMLYDESDIGKLKIEVAKEKLEKYNKNTQINIINKQISNENDLEQIISSINKIDFVISTLDTPRGKIRHIIDKVLYDKEIPYIFNGNVDMTLLSGPIFLKGKTKSFSDYIPILKKQSNDSILSEINSRFSSQVIEPLNSIAGQICSVEVLKYLTGIGQVQLFAKEFQLNLLTLNKKILDFEKEF